MTDLAVSQRPEVAKRSKVLLVGPGAIGLSAAAALLQGDVALDIATRTRFSHLQVTGEDIEEAFTVAVHTEPESIASYDGRYYDTVILAVKNNQLEQTAGWLRAAVGPSTILIALQSGLDIEDRIRPLLTTSTTPIIPAVVYTHSERYEPGIAHLHGAAQMVIPRSQFSDEIAELFADTLLEVEVSDNFRTAAWRKMVINASIGIMSILTGKPARAFADPEANKILRALIEEAAAVAKADGVDLGDDFGEKLAGAIPRISPDNLPTITLDRANGLETEWEARNQTIVQMAKQYGISVPLHSLGTTLIRIGEPGY